MAKITILLEGYVRKEKEIEYASSSAVLVQDKELNIVVDPGMAKEKLGKALQKASIAPEQVNYVLLTHYHPDHAYGAAWFPKAKIIDVESVYDGDSIIEHDGFVPGTELAIMHTPGHAHEHCSLAVSTEKGMVIIAGDLFYWSNEEEQKLDVHMDDVYAKDNRALVESRQKVLKLADYIIPGHGRIIKVK